MSSDVRSSWWSEIVNVVDLAIFLSFLSFYTLLFLAGIGRAVLTLMAWYLVVVAAAFFTGPLARGLREAIPAASSWATELLAFVLVVAVIGGLGAWGTLWSIRTFPVLTRREFGRGYGPASLLLQAALALLVALALLGTVVMVAHNTVIRLPEDALGVQLRAAFAGSRFVPMALDLAGWIRRLAIDWVPGEPPTLLSGT